MTKTISDPLGESDSPILAGGSEKDRSVVSADRTADFFEAPLAGGLVSFQIAYSAVRQLRASNNTGDGPVGLLVGLNSECVQIVRFESFRPPLGELPDYSAGLREAIRQFRQRESEGTHDLQSSLIGISRIQEGSWAESRESDAKLIHTFLTEGHTARCLFLLIRKFDYRPWAATLFVADLSGNSTPVLEFPFDDYLLVNGYVADLTPQSVPEPPKKTRVWQRKIPWILGVAALLVAAAIYSWSPHWSPKGLDPADADGSVTGSLGLDVHRKGEDFEVSWNRLLSAVRTASGGSLSIRESGVTKIVPLSPAQLREGSILYTPLTNDLDFRFEIQTNDKKPQAESVQVFGWAVRPPFDLQSAAPQDGRARSDAPVVARKSELETFTEPRRIVLPPMSQEGSVDSSSQKSKPLPAAQGNASPVVTEQQISKASGSVPVVTLPLQPLRRVEQELVALPESPTTVVSGPALPQDMVLSRTLPDVPSPRPAEAPTPQQIKIGQSLQASKLLHKVPPVYPPIAQAAGIQGVVRFMAVIGKDGRVKNLRLVSGAPIFADAARDALTQWSYRPMLLNGEPVEVITQIDVNFTLNH
jgi:TonB family protein